MSSKEKKKRKVKPEERTVPNAWGLQKDGPPKNNIKRNEGNKFEIACKQIENSVKRYIATHDLDLENNEEEEENTDVNKSGIIGRVLGSYENKDDLERTQHHLQEAFRSGALVCLVCIDNIKRNDSVWNCEECYCSFHLGCIQKWGKDSIFLQSQAEEENSLTNYGHPREKKSFKWFCPKCRHDYPSIEIPSAYKCFCGKQKNPAFDPWLIPHSCGEKCKKGLRPDCGHKCLLLCHPGPCPPCPVMVQHPCFCNQSRKQTRRCSSKAWSCEAVCRRLLGCNQHRCQNRCHDGPCTTCERTSKQKCQCGAKAMVKPCAALVWQCDKVCGRRFPCGHHTCEVVCHEGSCGECPLSGDRTCPCGKKTSSLPCTQAVPSCGDTCSKPLSCGVHFCAERCHKGSCPSCLQVRVKKCNCGAREKELPCSKNFTCEIKCKKIRDCTKHSCNRKCCLGECPPCDHPCGKTLGCGQHKCGSRCHQMRCFPCAVTHQICCACGQTSVTVPCGREKKTPIPKCDALCKKKPACHHSTPKPHNCHQGRCPPCSFVCGLKLSCKHTCSSTCHDAVPVKIVTQQKRAGPWEKITSPQIEIQKRPCPPCMVKMKNTCLGRHETCDWPCSELRPFSCGRKCGRVLDCSHHQCAKECHLVEGAKDEASQGQNCEPCTRQCSQPRPIGCNHQCKLSCHVDPCSRCREKVRLKCHCNLLEMIIDCHKWVTSNSHTKEIMQSCTNQCSKQISCGHRCQKQCHSGKCTSPDNCRKKVAVRCPCKRIRKDFVCNVSASGKAQVICDEVCKAIEEEKKKEEQVALLKQQLEEERIRKKELEEYERFLHGKKKKRSKRTQEVELDESQPWWRRKTVLGIGAVLLLSLFLYYILKT